MNSIYYRLGTKYSLYLYGPEPETMGKVSLGIKCSEKFAFNTNYVAVLLEKEKLEEIIKDLQRRVAEM